MLYVSHAKSHHPVKVRHGNKQHYITEWLSRYSAK